MSRIGKQGREAKVHKTFGGIEMVRQATVKLASMNPAPYNVNRVDRKAVFVFDAGRAIYELIDAEGRRWVMQTWSQTVDARSRSRICLRWRADYRYRPGGVMS
jgi:hypothetical protein